MKYKLENNEITVEFDTFGGQLTSIRDKKGTEYLWQGDKKYWGGQAPVLFPIVGSIRNKRAFIGENKTCCMERHGVVRKLEFEMEEITANTITFSITSNENTKKQYPYDFKLLIRYILNNKSITTVYTVVNNNNEVMPFQIGGHPGFNCPINKNENFEDYVVEFEYPETADCPTAVPSTGLLDVEHRNHILDNSKTLKMAHNLFKVDAVIFDSLKSRKVKLYNPQKGTGVQLEFKNFDNLLVWSSSNDGPFVALEPWSGLSTCSDEGDIFEKKRGVHLLPAGKEETLSFTISIIN